MEANRTNWRELLRAFVRSDSGPTATEYAVMLALIVLGSMGVIATIGHDFQDIYVAIADEIPEG